MKWWHWVLIAGGGLYLLTRKKAAPPVITGGVMRDPAAPSDAAVAVAAEAAMQRAMAPHGGGTASCSAGFSSGAAGDNYRVSCSYTLKSGQTGGKNIGDVDSTAALRRWSTWTHPQL